jgi:hypothetical protein
MKKFLIINSLSIGDVLFTTPLIKAIKDAECRANRKCIEDITVDEVFAAVKKLL